MRQANSCRKDAGALGLKRRQEGGAHHPAVLMVDVPKESYEYSCLGL